MSTRVLAILIQRSRPRVTDQLIDAFAVVFYTGLFKSVAMSGRMVYFLVLLVIAYEFNLPTVECQCTTKYCFDDDNDVDITKRFLRIHQETGSLKEETSSLKDEVGSLKEEIGSLKVETGSLKEDVSSLKMENGSLNEEAASLREEVGSLKEEISSLRAEVSSLKGQLSSQNTAAVYIGKCHVNV